LPNWQILYHIRGYFFGFFLKKKDFPGTKMIKTGIFLNETSQVERKEKVQLSALEATSTSTSAHWPKFYQFSLVNF
jgi:hypothetical protein